MESLETTSAPFSQRQMFGTKFRPSPLSQPTSPSTANNSDLQLSSSSLESPSLYWPISLPVPGPVPTPAGTAATIWNASLATGDGGYHPPHEALQAPVPAASMFQSAAHQGQMNVYCNGAQPSDPQAFIQQLTALQRTDMTAKLPVPVSSILAPDYAAQLIDRRKRRTKTFPEKFMAVLMKMNEEDTSSYFAWLPDNWSFVVVHPNRFVERILTPYFQQTKYASFVRKLHRWGFVRRASATGADCFHHPLFQRNRTDLASMIRSKPRPGQPLLPIRPFSLVEVGPLTNTGNVGCNFSTGVPQHFVEGTFSANAAIGSNTVSHMSELDKAPATDGFSSLIQAAHSDNTKGSFSVERNDRDSIGQPAHAHKDVAKINSDSSYATGSDWDLDDPAHTGLLRQTLLNAGPEMAVYQDNGNSY